MAAFALELAPDLAHTVDGEVLIEDATNLDLQSGMLPGARRPLGRIAPLGHMGVVGRGGDRQDLADRLDPMRPTMIVDEGDHGWDRRASPPLPKKKPAFRRVSLARPNPPVFPPKGLRFFAPSGRNPGPRPP